MRVRMKALAVGLTVLVHKAQTIKRELAASQMRRWRGGLESRGIRHEHDSLP